jgi:universal stress protein E
MPDTPYKTVLIAGNDRERLAATIDKAALIEHYTGAALRVAATHYHEVAELSEADLSPAETQGLIDHLVAAQAQDLSNALAPYRARVADLDSNIVWSKDIAAGLIAEATRIDASLLIKPRQAHRTLGEYLHAPIDWRLMRDAPCPVLFTANKSWDGPRVVLAALDAADVNHLSLNRSILRHARAFERILDAKLHLVCSYPDLSQTVSGYQVTTDFTALKEQMLRTRTERLTALVGELELTGAELHVVEGKPRGVIEHLAERLGATLTVVGTAARTGIGKLLIGNTAEDISRNLTTDLLTVRE